MDENTRQVEDGNKGVEVALSAFNTLPEVIAAVNKSAEGVGAIAQENASGAEEVSASIQEVTSSMQQVSSSAQQMASIATELKTIVECFKINQGQTSTIATSVVQQQPVQNTPTEPVPPTTPPQKKRLGWGKHHQTAIEKPQNETKDPVVKS